MQKKIIYIVIIAICIGGSFFSGRTSTIGNTEILESRIAEITADNERLTGQIRTITEGSNKLTKQLQSATSEIERLNGDLFAITNRFSYFGQGFSEIDSGLSGVIEGLDYYIEKAETPE